MKEPRPLLREGASHFERQLLNAAMRERPSPQLRSRMRRVLGLTGPLAWASGVKAMLAGLAGKGALGVAVAGLVAAGAVGLSSTRGELDVSDEYAAFEAPDRGAAAVPATLSVDVAPPTVVAAPSERAEGSLADSGELREEIRMLDAARAALQRGSAPAARQQLDRYRLRFPSGILSREAALLRQQAAATSAVRLSAHRGGR